MVTSGSRPGGGAGKVAWEEEGASDDEERGGRKKWDQQALMTELRAARLQLKAALEGRREALAEAARVKLQMDAIHAKKAKRAAEQRELKRSLQANAFLSKKRKNDQAERTREAEKKRQAESATNKTFARFKAQSTAEVAELRAENECLRNWTDSLLSELKAAHEGVVSGEGAAKYADLFQAHKECILENRQIRVERDACLDEIRALRADHRGFTANSEDDLSDGGDSA